MLLPRCPILCAVSGCHNKEKKNECDIVINDGLYQKRELLRTGNCFQNPLENLHLDKFDWVFDLSVSKKYDKRVLAIGCQN